MSIQKQIDGLVTYQAADWFEYFRGEHAQVPADSHRERQMEFMQWLVESPRNIEALLAIASEAPLLRSVLLEQLSELSPQLARLSPQVTRLQAEEPSRRPARAH